MNRIVAYFQITLMFKVPRRRHIALEQVWRGQGVERTAGCLRLPSEQICRCLLSQLLSYLGVRQQGVAAMLITVSPRRILLI